ncbi:hypothetical protein GPECTOR_17g794 [Gonium pectorale]|uniref:Guanylate cyclase domain-containing protein n=1 Tax=Gonium pectorale TaxID=33097 RepID=A0A150GK31_GONPE|nr:hypothetical protein GPECTOR_17g794 [Gonium pectorale]|eukprot:KXZ50158.1 hypothetical protein GPECTOR_17g794 [Gonium pectorale]
MAVCLSPEEERQLGATPGVMPEDCVPYLPSCSGRRVRGATIESVKNGAERLGLKITLSVLEDLGDGHELAVFNNWGRTVVYASPAYCTMIDKPDMATAIRYMNVTIGANAAIRSSVAGFLKLLLVGGEVVPVMMRTVIYHTDRHADLVCVWFFPVVLYGSADGGAVEPSSTADGTEPSSGSGTAARPPPRLGFFMYTDPESAATRRHEFMVRDHMGLKYTPHPVTMVDDQGFIMTQNPASTCALGVHGYEARLAGSTRFNYLTQLFLGDPGAEADMRATTAMGRSWSRRLRVSDSPVLRKWLELRDDEERWHDVQISRMRDPIHMNSSYIIAETDVTAIVQAQQQIEHMQRQQEALLRQILPQQVIDVMLATDDAAVSSEEAASRSSSRLDRYGTYDRLLSEGSFVLSSQPSGVRVSTAEPTAAAGALAGSLSADATPFQTPNASSSGAQIGGELAAAAAAALPAALSKRRPTLERSMDSRRPSSSMRAFDTTPDATTVSGATAAATTTAAVVDHSAGGMMLVTLPDGTVKQLDVHSEDPSEADSTIQLSRRDVMSLATWHESVTILFADIKGFTTMSQQLHPARVMLFLDTLYNAFDMLLDECGCYKVETIGDCYMVCGGLFARPGPNGEMRLGGVDPHHAPKVLRFAKQMADVASRLRTPLGDPVEMRIGLHSGPCMSGVVGRRMPRFCLFGDTINTASRMESTGLPGRIHVSEATHSLLPDEPWEVRGEGIEVKGKGRMQTYLWGGDMALQCHKARDRVISKIAGVKPEPGDAAACSAPCTRPF